MLNGEVALVVGGFRGAAKYLSLDLCNYGADVIIIGREEKELEEMHKLNEKKISYFVGDITNEDTIKNLVKNISEKYGKLNILVNNLDFYDAKSIKELKISDYDKLFNYNVRAPVNLTKEFLPLILKCKGQIINIFSTNSSYCSPMISMYSGAVAAFNQISNCWSKELSENKIKINSLSPVTIDIDNWKEFNLIFKCGHEALIREKDERAKIIAEQAFFFINKEGFFITGSNLSYD